MSFGQRSFIVPPDPSINASNLGVRRMLDVAVNVIWFTFGASAIVLLMLGIVGILSQNGALNAITALAFFSAMIVFLMSRFAPFTAIQKRDGVSVRRNDGSDVPNGE